MRLRVFLCSLACAALFTHEDPGTKAPPPSMPPRDERPVAPPRLSIQPSGRVHLGSVGPREKKTIDYTFTNTSKTPIRIRVADLSPGVTVAGPALEKEIPPGKGLPLTLSVDPTDFVGWQPRSVRLISDDPAQGEYRLPIGMDVRPDLTVDGQGRTFGIVAPHESPAVTFRFRRETGDPTVLRLTKPLPPYLQTSLDPHGDLVDLRVVLRAGLVPAGATSGLEVLAVETNSPHQPAFTLYAEWKVQHAIEPIPSRIVMTDAATTQATLTLKARNGKPFVIEKAVVEDNGFSIEPAQPAGTAEQVMTIHRTATATARAVLVLSIKGQDSPLKVPLAFLPPQVPAESPGPGRDSTGGASRP
jgi:hypothetical protein